MLCWSLELCSSCLGRDNVVASGVGPKFCTDETEDCLECLLSPENKQIVEL